MHVFFHMWLKCVRYKILSTQTQESAQLVVCCWDEYEG